MPTKSPLLVLGKKDPPGPKLVGPLNPPYAGTFTLDCPAFITPLPATIPAAGATLNSRVSPVKLTAPLPVTTTSDPTCFSVIVKAWAGCTEKNDVTAIP